MKHARLVFFLVLAAGVLTTFSAYPRPSLAAASAAELPALQLAGMASITSQPNSMVIRCEGYHCTRHHELVYWGFDNRIYFLKAGTLAPLGEPLRTSDSISTIQNERYLFYDRYYQQVYAIDKVEQGSFPNTWYRLIARVIRGYNFAGAAEVNAEFNTPLPVDRYYPIDGAALQQPMINTGAVARIFVDNPVNGNVDIVTFHGHHPDTAQATRINYRSPLGCASNAHCSWHENAGSSLAVGEADFFYIADNNDFIDQIVVGSANGIIWPPIDQVGTLFKCFVDEAGIAAAAEQKVLYLPAGCQSFADGGVAQLDLSGQNAHRVIDLPYYDQGLLVDWFDQKRVFVATSDFEGRYDPQRYLYLHLIYDGQLIATLPVMADYTRGDLSAMAFDPHTNLLYLAVDRVIYKVQVNYGGTAGFPPLPQGEGVITPGADYDLIASDSSAVFHFTAGAVDADTRVTYRELPGAGAPGGETQPSASTRLYPMRQFELTAVHNQTGAPLAAFNSDYQLKLYYSPQEIAPISGGYQAIQLYRWNGSAWQQTGSTYGSFSATLLTIYANQTGLFALAGPTYPLFLPAVLR